ncbi:hypothetical protein B0H10DRAFT_2215032 [Mycena sp. CBHHK59/15]|nr:hypothetical protein B0H10DRAFT_2215032 [Mycena sp. CBHHK59/15]
MPPLAPANMPPLAPRCKHRITELEAQIKKAEGGKPPISSMKSYINLGRCIHKVVSAFDSIDSLIVENDRRQDLEEVRASSEDVDDEEEEPTAEQDHLYRGYKELMRYIPPLRKALNDANHEELSQIIAALRNGARNARSDDTKNLREAIVPWLHRVFPDIDPVLDPASHDNRGLDHDTTGGLLCPVEDNWADPEVRENIREGHLEFPVMHNSWFIGLYPQRQFDPNNPEQGLFKNLILLMVYKYIFTSPHSAKSMSTNTVNGENVDPSTATAAPKNKRGKKKTVSKSKRSVAALIGMTRVSGRSIAYAAVQYRNDGAFDYVQFYDNIVDYFESAPGPIAKLEVAQLLDWWNSYVFGTATQWSLYEGGSAPATSSVARMNAARAAREVRA